MTDAKTTIRAAVMEGARKVTLRSFLRPTLPPGSVLIAVDAVGVCGSDRHMYHGDKDLGFPFIPGHEMVGRIVEMTPEAKKEIMFIGGEMEVGARVVVLPGTKPCGQCYICRHLPARPALCKPRWVYGFVNCNCPPHLLGGYAERMVVLAGSWLYAVPENLSFERAVLTEPLSVAMRAVERGLVPAMPGMREGIGVGQSAVVVGAGPIGLLAVAVLSTMGLSPIVAIDLVPRRLELARKLGAKTALNLKEYSADRRAEVVREMTEGAGADIVVECAGVPAAFAEALELVRRGGTVIEVGHYADTGGMDLHPSTICYKDLAVFGSYAFPPTQFGPSIEMLKNSPLPIEQLVTGRFSLEQAEQALISAADPNTIKNVITPGT